ncbi:MAG: dihydrofolate reductase family protein [Acidimicrobiales bacterium]
MGLVHLDIFSTLDGVAQAPGTPDEDPEGGFLFGGWQAPLGDPEQGREILAGMEGMDALLLGRRTYDIFAGYWPAHDGQDDVIADLFNRIPKYVASRQPRRLEWAHSVQLGDDLPAAVRRVREQHEHVHVIGSLDLAQTLLAHQLVDRLTLWVYPITLGRGKRLWRDGIAPTSFELVQPALTTPRGAVLLRYARLEAAPTTGDMSLPDRGVG